MRYGVWIRQPDGSLKAGLSPRAEKHKKTDKPKAAKPPPKPAATKTKE